MDHYTMRLNSTEEECILRVFNTPVDSMSTADVKALFGRDSTPRLANAVGQRAPKLYRQIRADRAIPMGLLGTYAPKQPQPQPQPNVEDAAHGECIDADELQRRMDAKIAAWACEGKSH